MIIEKLELGMIDTNCYLAMHSDTKETLIIDPADQAQAIIRKLQTLQAVPAAILLTHAHFDHIGAVDELVRLLETAGRNIPRPLPVYILDEEAPHLTDLNLNLSRAMHSNVTAHADHLLQDGQTIRLAGFDMTAIHTPGHTSGSACYYFPQENVLFSGDTLFYRSVGRTDFPTGDMRALHASLHNRLFLLPDEVRVYPGHGPDTLMGDEKKYNPY